MMQSIPLYITKILHLILLLLQVEKLQNGTLLIHDEDFVTSMNLVYIVTLIVIFFPHYINYN